MGFSRQEYWSGLPFPSPGDHILSNLSTMTRPSWVALQAWLDFTELDKVYDPAIPLLDIHSAETRIERDMCTPMFIAAGMLLHSLSQPWGQPRWAGHDGEVWQNVVHWRRERQTTSVFLLWEPHEQYEKAKWWDTERGTPQVSRCLTCYWRSVEK